MNETFKFFLKKISAFVQTKKKSFNRHNSEYKEHDKLERERLVAEQFERDDVINNQENKIDVLLGRHPEIKGIAIDIGSGAGWYSKKLSERFSAVIAIEPSLAAINIARELYDESKKSNILWIEGFAENVLNKFHFASPVIFFTGVVLSHLRDKEVKDICMAIELCAPVGSILSFNECWGLEHHQLMWHVRTKEWWQAQLPGWQLNFHGPVIQNVPGRHKGIHGVKIK